MPDYLVHNTHSLLMFFFIRQNYKKIGQYLFFTGELAFFYSKFCVFNNVLGPEEMIL